MDAVTIRRLATELGVTPMALYWHFRNKDALLDGMAAGLFDAIDPAVDVDAAWPVQLRTLCGSVLAALRSHRAVAVLAATRTVTAEPALRVTEALLDVLRRAGFSPAEATRVARHGLWTLVHLVDRESGVVGRGDGPTPRVPADRYPRLAEAAGPLGEGVDPDEHVRFGFELLLAGIEAIAAGRD